MTKRRRDETGATALLVGAMAVVLVLMASFTVDFGMAYVSKRQLQTAADGASLAAAATFADLPSTLDCEGLLGYVNPSTGVSAKQIALDVADEVLEENRPGAVRVNTAEDDIFDCPDDGSWLSVTIEAEGETDVALGGVAGVSQIRTHRSATATLDAPDTALGVRPYMICSTQLPTSIPDTAPRKIVFPKKTGDTGPPEDKTPGPKDPKGPKDPADPDPVPSDDPLLGCPYAGGNWFTVDCPHDKNGDNGDLAENTLEGCDSPISRVSPQGAPPNALRESLLPACEPVDDWDEDCLTANPGDPNGEKVRKAWDTLIGKEIVLPVFCGSVCDDPATPDIEETGWKDQGNNTAYPVYRLAGVKVCAWHWSSKHSDPYNTIFPDVTDDDPCRNADASAGDPNENYLMVAYTTVEITGTTKKTSCPLDECNLRRVLLTQ